MPFVSSVRGSFGATSENRGVSNASILSEIVRQNPNASILPTGGTINVAGGYRIHTFNTVGSNALTFQSGGLPTNAEVYMWGGGGGSGGSGVVILSIPTSSYSGTTTGSPTVTTSGSNTILKYTSSGTYTG